MRGDTRIEKVFLNKTVYISGGSSGIGLACAELLITCAARIVLIARDITRLQAAEQTLRKATKIPAAEIHIISADVSDSSALQAAVQQAIKRIAPPDVVIHSAGYVFPAPFDKLDEREARRMFDVNINGTWNMFRCTVPTLNHGALVVAISSFAALLGVFGYSAYAASKSAVVGLAEALRNELRPRGVTVKVACPSDTDTPQLEYENRHKPAETKAIAGTVKPYSARYVARYILARCRRRNPFLIIPGLSPKVIWFFKRIWPTLPYRIIDTMLRKYTQR